MTDYQIERWLKVAKAAALSALTVLFLAAAVALPLWAVGAFPLKAGVPAAEVEQGIAATTPIARVDADPCVCTCVQEPVIVPEAAAPRAVPAQAVPAAPESVRPSKADRKE